MLLPKIVRVAVEQTAFHFDKLYEYTFPEPLGEPVRGCRVMVPFGGGNKRRQGIIVDVAETPEIARLKPVFSVLDDAPLLNDEMLDLALWIRDRTFCTCFDAAKSMIPVGMLLNVRQLYTAAPISDEQRDTLVGDELAAWRIAEKSYRPAVPQDSGVLRDVLYKKLGLTPGNDLAERLVYQGILVRSDGAFRRMGDATIRMVRLSPETAAELLDGVPSGKYTPKQTEVVRFLLEVGGASVKEMCYFCSVTSAVITTLEKKGVVECYETEVLRTPRAAMAMPEIRSVTLSPEQQAAFDELLGLYQSGSPAASLLYGVTGSGKTQVYMNLIDRVISDGRQALVMVPEIALTPQLLSLFTARYGRRVAMLHSGLAIGERNDEWKRISRGDAPIVIGTRSAIFAPFSSLGLIVMDEEQEHTYKSESTPRYHTRDVARWRCNRNNALLVFSSATPSVETFHAAMSGRYSLQKLPSRFGQAALPQVDIVDMCRQPDGGSDIISPALRDEIEYTLEHGHQAILLLNRRGFNTFVSCRSCGHVITCPQCSISLTYHRANDRVMCHYCGYSQPPFTKCPGCESDKVRYSGLGTQRAETELERMFPSARVLRMDADTTMSRTAYEKRFGEFAAGEYDIMIGTQMVAKGLDFPHVRLVGVLSADQSLYGDDYRCFETTFALLTQVVGRAGRRDTGGKAVIQTSTPDNYVIELAAVQDYEQFYETEIESRRMLKYPPYTDLCMFAFVGTDEQQVQRAAHDFLKKLHDAATGEYRDTPMIALDPSPATIGRIAGKYRYKLLVKTRFNARMREMTGELIKAFSRLPEHKNVTVFVDVNPVNLM